MKNQLELKTITTSLRPHKVAVLVDKHDPDWQESCIRIIEWFSQTWGGAYNLIVPTDGQEISDTFWQILKQYDPDYIYRYQKTFKDIKIIRPQEYKQMLDTQVDSFIKTNPGSNPNFVRSELDKQAGMMRYKFEINDSLKEDLANKLNVFRHREQAIEGEVIARSLVRHPLTNLLEIIYKADISKLAHIESFDNSLFDLFIYSSLGTAIGLINSLRKINDKNKRLNFHVTDKEIAFLNTLLLNAEILKPEEIDLYELLNTCWDQKINDSKLGFTSYLSDQLEQASGITKKKINNDVYPILPYPTSLLKCNFYYRIDDFHAKDECPIIVVSGDKLEDFCLYYCLSRLRDDVLWAPLEFLRKFKFSQSKKGNLFVKALGSNLYERTDYGHNERRAIITSVTASRDSLKRIAKRIQESCLFTYNNGEPLISVASKAQNLLPYSRNLFEDKNQHNRYSDQFLDGLSVNFLDTPRPRMENFSSVNVLSHRWISEVNILGRTNQSGYKLPQKAIFSKSVFRDINAFYNRTNTVRVSKHGVAYFCPTMGFISGNDDVESLTIRPRVQMLTDLQVFRELFQSIGYSIAVSDKGNYFRESMERFGSLSQICEKLRNKNITALFDRYLDKSNSAEATGVFIKDRRFLDFKVIKKIIGNEEAAIELVDEMIEKDIFHRGLIFQCQRCKDSSWYSISKVGKKFTCERCDTEQAFTSTHWKKPEEPQWYYRLNEMIYQGYRSTMIVPLLTLDRLAEEAKESFIFLPEIELRKNSKQAKPDIEIDISCIVDGQIYIGECKASDKLGKTTKQSTNLLLKYCGIADTLDSGLVFSTISKAWNGKIRKTIEEEGRGKKLRFFCRDDLFN